MPELDDARWREDREGFHGLHAKRRQRERQRANFLEKQLRTPRTARRWFRMEDIEPDAHARSNLVYQWRASIWKRDLCLDGKSQVLCLSASPLAENRLDPNMAGGQPFYKIVGDLWMSAPRWLAWFRQDLAQRKPPAWLETMLQPQSRSTRGGRKPEYDHDDAVQFCFQLLDERGDFDEPGQVNNWNSQRHLEDEVRTYLTKPSDKEPSSSTVRRIVTKARDEWRARKSA